MTSVLTSEQLHALRNALEERFNVLRVEILDGLSRADNERYTEIAQQTHDLEDQSLADLLVDLNLADIDRHVSEIRDIEAAQIRITEGNYGICSECGEAVGFQRLLAHPTAKRCIGCQTRYETRRGERHPSI